MLAKSPGLDTLAKSLSLRSPMNADDFDFLQNLPHRIERFDAGSYLIREGTHPDTCPVILDGFTFRQKLTVFGSRQIISLQIPGDMIDVQNLFLDESDHNVQSLSTVTVAHIRQSTLEHLLLSRPHIARAIWIQALVEASIYREWIVNIGRRDARTRIAHFLCEFCIRLKAIGLARDDSFELPMTQEHLADCTGLTPVHVNRVLKQLSDTGLIVRNKRHIMVAKWAELAHEADFSQRYLHIANA